MKRTIAILFTQLLGVAALADNTSIQAELLAEGAFNPTYSPDSSRIAYTLGNDLYVTDVATGERRRITSDGSEVILNGYASWVYYEEILGRPSKYKAFWWSPDSEKIGFYRFDNSDVPVFPICSPSGRHGKLMLTRYPKAGDSNPVVRIGIARADGAEPVVWAAFDETADQYFGIPFWGPDSREFFVAREPRVQQELDLYAVSVENGAVRHVYHEAYPCWVDWIEQVQFTDMGLYMARSFETGWEQIYFLSYDGKTFKRLTDGRNWNVSIVRVDEKRGEVYFTALRDSDVRDVLYRVDRHGRIKALTDTSLNAANVKFSPDGEYFTADLSSLRQPVQHWRIPVSSPDRGKMISEEERDSLFVPQHIIHHTLSGGYTVPAAVTLPEGFDGSRKYPVIMEIYGGPGSRYVRDCCRSSYSSSMRLWCYRHGIIYVTADSAVSGENGRYGMDLAYGDLLSRAVSDFVEWARYLGSLPYVDADRIGVEGFSFGGTNTAVLLLEHSDVFRCGIAGGGVYDWMLYDSHYTERFMNTPWNNPNGYAACRVLDRVKNMKGGVLKLTHGTGDDNVHFQQTLQLVDALQRAGKQFELMIYPDGMHGYRGVQKVHSDAADREFWTRNLLSE